MAGFIKIVDNLIRVSQRLGYPASFNSPHTKEEYDTWVRRDKDRTRYVSLLTVPEMQEKLGRTDHLYDEVRGQLWDEEKPLSFTQGGFNAKCFSDSFLPSTLMYRDCFGKDNEGFTDCLAFAYQEGNNYCAFAISYIRDDRDTEIPRHQRPLYPVIAHIKNSNAALQDREVTLFIHPALKELNPEGRPEDAPPLPTLSEPTVSDEDLGTEIDNALQSPFVSHLIQEVLENGTLSLSRFDELKSRLTPGKNLDNRDEKQKQLEEMFSIATHPLLRVDIDVFRQGMNHPDFFKSGNFENNLTHLFLRIQRKISSLEQGKYRNELEKRNKTTFTELLLQNPSSMVAQYDDHIGMEAKDFWVLEHRKALEEESRKTMEECHKEYEANSDDCDAIAPSVPSPTRNHGAIALNVLSALTFVSMGLVATGILAPLGIALEGLAIMAIVATATAVGLLATAKIVWNKYRFKVENTHYQAKLNDYQTAVDEHSARKIDTEETYESSKKDLEQAKADVVEAEADLKKVRVNKFVDSLVQDPSFYQGEEINHNVEYVEDARAIDYAPLDCALGRGEDAIVAAKPRITLPLRLEKQVVSREAELLPVHGVAQNCLIIN